MGTVVKRSNTIRARGVYGKYKNADIEVDIKPLASKCEVRVHGKKITNCVGVWIKLVVGKPTTMFLEFDAQADGDNDI